MGKIRIGILGPSEIAARRFLPALESCADTEYLGVAVAGPEEWMLPSSVATISAIVANEFAKAEKIRSRHGGRIYTSYRQLLESTEVDAVYIPLPPALHFHWAKSALESGKHVLLEKPSTTNLEDSLTLIRLAEANNLVLHENYAFRFHRQIQTLVQTIHEGVVGEVRLYRTAFGFPYRGGGDFRYNAGMGGGALLDCGGYPVKLASVLLGDSARVTAASLCPARGHEVDVFGSATLMARDGTTAQISFGMDNHYKCEFEVWGSEGCILVPRIFTPTADMHPTIFVRTSEERTIEVSPDDQFAGSIRHFLTSLIDDTVRYQNYTGIAAQAKLVAEIRALGMLPGQVLEKMP